MKSTLISVAVLTTVSGIAMAADLPVRVAPAPVVRPACGQFGGAYLGGNVGWGFYKNDFHDRDGLSQFVDTGLPSNVTSTDNAVVGGAQLGYNFQRNCTVWGLEADWSWTGLKTSEFSQDGDQSPAVPLTDSLTVASKMQWFGTLRGRAGVVVDDMLLYATAGLAYANFDRTYTYFQDGPVTTAAFNSSKTKLGWTAGAGAEWKWMEQWTVKAEFLYMQFEQDTLNVSGVAGAIGNAGISYRLSSNDAAWVTRFGINYRF